MVTELSGPAAVFTRQLVSVSFRVANLGLAPMTNAIKQRVWLAPEPFPGDFVGRICFYSGQEGIPPGFSFQQSVSVFMPLEPGLYWLVVVADADNAAVEIDKNNNTMLGNQLVQVVEEYTATVATDVTTALAGTPVPMPGR